MSNKKKIYNKGWVILGLVVFLGLVTSPVWLNQKGPAPEVVLTEKAKAAKECVAPVEYMRADHMKILDEWRHSVVRNDTNIYVSSTGKEYTMSLTNTCLDCHSNYDEFCDKCHKYASVKLYCWDCHIQKPKEFK